MLRDDRDYRTNEKPGWKYRWWCVDEPVSHMTVDEVYELTVAGWGDLLSSIVTSGEILHAALPGDKNVDHGIGWTTWEKAQLEAQEAGMSWRDFERAIMGGLEEGEHGES